MATRVLAPEAVLQTLEEQMSELAEFGGATFQMLEDYYALGDARLSVFRSDRLWVIAIEAIRYETRGEMAALDDVWLYGNAISFGAGRFVDLSRRTFTTPRAWQTRVEDENHYPFGREKFSILWRGRRFDFAPSREELEAAGIFLSRREWESGELSPFQVMRYVCHTLDHPFFASEDVLRDLIDGNLLKAEYQSDNSGPVYRSWFHTDYGDFDEPPTSCDLELFLQTREWRHPRFGSIDEDLSIRDAFERLARAIASGDLSHWENQDATRFNSHWSNWTQTEAQIEALHNQHRLFLLEEGERFQKLLQNLPALERDKILAELRAQWQQEKIETTKLLRDVAAQGSPLIYASNSTLEWEGETFTWGPHLWGEEDDRMPLSPS